MAYHFDTLLFLSLAEELSSAVDEVCALVACRAASNDQVSLAPSR